MAIQPYNEKSATTWGSGGAKYDLISEAIADSTEHLLNRLGVRPGERALDLASRGRPTSTSSSRSAMPSRPTCLPAPST
jgi:hypothetical protein